MTLWERDSSIIFIRKQDRKSKKNTSEFWILIFDKLGISFTEIWAIMVLSTASSLSDY